MCWGLNGVYVYIVCNQPKIRDGVGSLNGLACLLTLVEDFLAETWMGPTDPPVFLGVDL